MENPSTLPARSARRRRKIQRLRRVVLLSTILGALALVVGTGVSFTATNDTSTVAISAGGINSGGVTDFASVSFSANAVITGVRPVEATTGTTFVQPAWAPTVDQVVPVSTAGDLAIINASGTTGNILVTVTLTNPVGLSRAYSYFNLPIDIYQSTNAGASWHRQTSGAAGTRLGDSTGITYLSLTNGYVSFLLAGGTNTLYELHIPKVIPSSSTETVDATALPGGTGTVPTGSFYTIDATGTLAPSISVTLTAAG